MDYMESRMQDQIEGALHSQQEAMERIDQLEKERDDLRDQVGAWIKANATGGWIDTLRAELDAFRGNYTLALGAIDALRAEFDALKAWKEGVEKQEPVAWMKDQWSPDCGNYWELCREDEMGWRERKDWSPLYASPIPAQSVPDGFREGAEAAARLIDQKAELYATRFGYHDMGGLLFGQGPHAESKMDHYTGLLELADELRAALAAAPKPEVK